VKKILIKATITITILGALIFGLFILLQVSPYEYTKLYGNAETEKLYTAYKMANDKAPMKRILKYLHRHNIEYVEHKDESVIALYADTEGHGETVLIWYKNGMATGARFDDFL